MKKRMKVIHVLNSNSFSGAENVVCEICELFKEDESVEMFYCSPNGPISKTLNERGIHFCPINGLSRNELQKVVDEIKPDIIHAHDFRATCISASLKSSIPVISHIHNNALWIKKCGIKSILFLLSTLRVKKIFGVSASVIDEYAFGNLIKGKFQVLENFINIDNVILKSEQIDSNCQYDVGFCGRFEEPKNPLKFLEIIKELKKDHCNIKACMIGDGSLKNMAIAFCEKNDLIDTVKFLGFKDNPFPYIRNTKVMVMPSIYEGFGLVAIESMALGVPVIAAPVGGLKNIINDKCGKLCEETIDYVEEITHLLDDYDYYNHKSYNAKKAALQFGNKEKYKNILYSEYKLLQK